MQLVKRFKIHFAVLMATTFWYRQNYSEAIRTQLIDQMSFLSIYQVCCALPRSTITKNSTQTEKPPVLQAFSMYGIANQDGIVFSSLNGIATVHNPLSSLLGSIFSPGAATQSTNINSNLNQIAAVASNQVNTIQAPDQSSLTFAPLPTSSSTSASTSATSTTLLPSKPIQRPTIKPSLSSVFSSATTSTANQFVVTRPENQCGLSNVTKLRVVGGDITQIGMCSAVHACVSCSSILDAMTSFSGQYPWIAALGYRFPNTSYYGLQFHCAGSLITLTHVLTTAHCISDYLYVFLYFSVPRSIKIKFNNFSIVFWQRNQKDFSFVWVHSTY